MRRTTVSLLRKEYVLKPNKFAIHRVVIFLILVRKTDGKMIASLKAFEIEHKNIVYSIITFFTIFGQNTVEFYDNHIL